MNNSTVYVGKTCLMNEEIDFEFNNFILKIYLSRDLTENLLFQKGPSGMILTGRKKPLPTTKFIGTTNDGTHTFVFYIDNVGYGYTSNTLFMNGSVLKIRVKKFIIYNSIRHPSTNTMIFYSKSFHRFLDMIPNFENKQNEEGELTFFLNCKFDTTKLISTFTIDDIEFELKPTFKCNWNGPKIDFTPGLQLKFNKTLSDEQVDKIYDTFIHFIQYSFMRKDIYPEAMTFNNGDGDGEIHSIHSHYKFEEEKVNDIWRDSFTWSILYKHAGELFKTIYEGNIHLLNNQETLDSRLYVSFVSISKDAAAFEYEFDKAFPDGVPYSTERKQIETEILNEITPLKDSSEGKKRKIYKGFIKHVHMESLEDKMGFAFETYSNCIALLKQRIAPNFTSEKMAEACADIRNDVDHGNKITDIGEDVATSFAMLRALIYAIQLRQCGFMDDDINVLTNILYCVKGLPR